MHLSQEDQGHVGQGEERDDDQGQPGQVLLHDGRPGEGPADPAAERGREPPALAGVQEYEPDEGDAEHGVEESQYVYHALTLSHVLRLLHHLSEGTVCWAASTSRMKLSTSRLAPPTRAPSTSLCAMISADRKSVV